MATKKKYRVSRSWVLQHAKYLVSQGWTWSKAMKEAWRLAKIALAKKG